MPVNRSGTRSRAVRAPLAAALACLLLCACVVVPVTTEGYDPDCRVITHHMTLKVRQVQELQDCSGSSDCLLQYLAIFGVTAAVSGSVMLVGNVVYWAEERAACAPPAPATTSS